MTSTELLLRINQLLDAFDGLTLWKTVAEWGQFLDARVDGVASGIQNPNTNPGAQTRNEIAHFVNRLKAESIASMIREIAIARNAIEKFRGTPTSVTLAFEQQLSYALDNFEAHHEACIKEQTITNIAADLFAALSLSKIYQSWRSALELVRHWLTEANPIEAYTKIVTIIFPGSGEMQWVADILIVTEQFYDHLCKLIGETEKMVPVKIETGSSLAVTLALNGGSRLAAMHLFVGLLRGLVPLFTMKHQLDDHEKKRQMVQNMAQLIGDLKKQGVNTGAFESRLNAEVAMLFSDADRILRYGPRILIDGKPVDIAQTGPLISEPPQKPDAPRLPNQPDSSGTSKQ